MTRAQLLVNLKREIRKLMATLSINEITENKVLISQIEIVLNEFGKAA